MRRKRQGSQTKVLTPRQIHEREKAQQEAALPSKGSQGMTATERRDWFRKQAGWPALRNKQRIGEST